MYSFIWEYSHLMGEGLCWFNKHYLENPTCANALETKKRKRIWLLQEGTFRLVTACLWGIWGVLGGDDQGPSERGLYPNTDLPIGKCSSWVYFWDRKKDTKPTVQEVISACSAPDPFETLDNDNNSPYILCDTMLSILHTWPHKPNLNSWCDSIGPLWFSITF